MKLLSKVKALYTKNHQLPRRFERRVFGSRSFCSDCLALSAGRNSYENKQNIITFDAKHMLSAKMHQFTSLLNINTVIARITSF